MNYKGNNPESGAGHDLECENITKRFGKFTAVDDVSFTIPSGSFFSILGPSGCGKTTLMRMIAGFDSPQTGDIKIKGKSVLSLPPNKRNVKMVFQHLALFPMMNVYENIAYGLRCQGFSKSEIEQKVKDVLARISLPDVGEKEVNQLSGGQKQRIAIARCMVLEPDVLLLDEPLGALDLKLRESMKVELKLLQSQFGTTFVYITHDQSEALVMSDNVAVMKDGRFEQIGTPQQLYHNPQTSFVASFVGDANHWQGTVLEAGADSIVVKTESNLVMQAKPRCNSTLKVGDKTNVYIRPEFIDIKATNAANSGEVNPQLTCLRGTIDSLLFNGANSRVLVRVVNDKLVEVDFNFRGEGSDLQVGDSVVLSWAADRVSVFANDS